MKKVIVLLSLFVGVVCVVPEKVQAYGYFNFGIGGDIAAGGNIYSGRDPRFQFQVEAGNQWFAVPVSFSTGQDVIILGFKPRFQYYTRPFRDYPHLAFAPGFGIVFNYWNASANGFVSDLDAIEFGMQLSANIRYDFADNFHIQFTPMALDINFWRKLYFDSALGSGSASNSDLGLVYNILVSAGIRF